MDRTDPVSWGVMSERRSVAVLVERRDELRGLFWFGSRVGCVATILPLSASFGLGSIQSSIKAALFCADPGTACKLCSLRVWPTPSPDVCSETDCGPFRRRFPERWSLSASWDGFRLDRRGADNRSCEALGGRAFASDEVVCLADGR